MGTSDKKDSIRSASARVFAERGFDRASIRDVAKACSMSLAGLYYYYKGKDEILFDIQHEAFRTLLDAHAAALAGVKDPEQKLAKVVDAHLKFFAEDIPRMKVMSREADQLSGDYDEKVKELRRRYVRLVRGILDELGQGTKLRDVPTGVAVFLLFGMMNWLYTWYDPEKDGAPEELAEAVRTVFLRGLLG